jgi:hypothetical protein
VLCARGARTHPAQYPDELAVAVAPSAAAAQLTAGASGVGGRGAVAAARAVRASSSATPAAHSARVASAGAKRRALHEEGRGINQPGPRHSCRQRGAARALRLRAPLMPTRFCCPHPFYAEGRAQRSENVRREACVQRTIEPRSVSSGHVRATVRAKGLPQFI